MTDTIAEIRARHEAAEKDGGHEWCGVHGPAAHADRAVLLARVAELEGALKHLVGVIDAAGPLNLSNGVQLGPTVWYVKCCDAMEHAAQYLKETP